MTKARQQPEELFRLLPRSLPKGKIRGNQRQTSVLIQQAEPAARFSHLIQPDRQGLCGVR